MQLIMIANAYHYMALNIRYWSTMLTC